MSLFRGASQILGELLEWSATALSVALETAKAVALQNFGTLPIPDESVPDIRQVLECENRPEGMLQI